VLARALAKHPDDRYPDGQTLAEDIEDVLKKRRRATRRLHPQVRTGSGTLVSAPPSPRGVSRAWALGLLAASLVGLAAALLGPTSGGRACARSPIPIGSRGSGELRETWR